MNDELYKALSKGYADEVEQLNALELIETQQNSIMHRNDLLAELARNVEELQAEVARLTNLLLRAVDDIEKGWLAIEGVEEKYNTDWSWHIVQDIRAALEYKEADQ
jgi:hypothetical protein